MPGQSPGAVCSAAPCCVIRSICHDSTVTMQPTPVHAIPPRRSRRGDDEWISLGTV